MDGCGLCPLVEGNESLREIGERELGRSASPLPPQLVTPRRVVEHAS